MAEKNKVIIDPPLRNIEGVSYKAAQKIEEQLKKGRRYFGSSGASMTYQFSSPEYDNVEGLKKEVAKEMLEGERDTTTFLKKWIKDKPNVVMIESVSVPDWDKEQELNEEYGIIDTPDTDHVLLIGSEVLLIDTKRWKKKKTYSVSDEGTALMTNKQFPGGEILMKESIYSWLDYLDEDASITGIVCINTEEATVIRNKNWYTEPFRLVELDRFEELLDEKWKMTEDEEKEHINTTLASQIIVQCIKPFDVYSKVFQMDTLRDFK